MHYKLGLGSAAKQQKNKQIKTDDLSMIKLYPQEERQTV